MAAETDDSSDVGVNADADDDVIDQSELSRRCHITRNVDDQKISASKSFILQDLYTNTLYIVSRSATSVKEVRQPSWVRIPEASPRHFACTGKLMIIMRTF